MSALTEEQKSKLLELRKRTSAARRKHDIYQSRLDRIVRFRKSLHSMDPRRPDLYRAEEKLGKMVYDLHVPLLLLQAEALSLARPARDEEIVHQYETGVQRVVGLKMSCMRSQVSKKPVSLQVYP